MKISFPHMGNILTYKKIMELLGHEVVVPPRPSKKTFDLGAKYSPEHACFPYKAVMGTYLEVIEMGVDKIVTSGGSGPCRAGFYSELQQRDLKALGHDVEIYTFDSIYRYKEKFMKVFNLLKADNSWYKVVKSVRFTFKMTEEIDRFDKKMHKIMPYEINQGETEKAWKEINRLFDEAYTRKELNKAIKKGDELLDSIEIHHVDEDKKIKIGIVGEIYVVMESSVNYDVEKTLAELGCETERSQNLSEWLNDNLKLPGFIKGTKGKSREEEILAKGAEFIEIPIGGHAKQTVGHIIDYKEQGFDGIVHLMPFGCLPELMTQSVTPKLSEKYDIPVLSLSLDEQTGQANSRTRLEAFVDLIKNKKLNKYSA